MKKLITVLDALRDGAEVKMDGKTYVWLKKPVVTRVIGGVEYGIEGLAVKSKSFTGDQDPNDWESGTDTYMGANEIPLSTLYAMAEAIPDKKITELEAGNIWRMLRK